MTVRFPHGRNYVTIPYADGTELEARAKEMGMQNEKPIKDILTKLKGGKNVTSKN